MNELLPLVAGLFIVIALMLWAAMHFGSRWFARRQRAEAHHAASQLEAMFIFTGAAKLFQLNVLAVIALPVVIWLLTRNWVLVALSVGVAFLVPRQALKFLASRRLRQIEQQLPDAILMVVGALHAGASLTTALESVASENMRPISQELDLLLREIRVGVDFGVALKNLERRVPLPEMVMLTSGIALSREVGANLAETLNSIGSTIRSKLQMEGKIRSLTAQGKMQGLVMAALPVFLAMILRFMEPEAMAPLFDTWYGWITMTVVGVMILIGYHFIAKITNIDI